MRWPWAPKTAPSDGERERAPERDGEEARILVRLGRGDPVFQDMAYAVLCRVRPDLRQDAGLATLQERIQRLERQLRVWSAGESATDGEDDEWLA